MENSCGSLDDYDQMHNPYYGTPITYPYPGELAETDRTRKNKYVEITKELEEMREKALKLHVSQMPFVSRLGSNLYLALRDKHMGEKCGKELAEGFFVMAPMHQHCMSETSKW